MIQSKKHKTITLICHNCNHKWQYKGKSKFYASCPVCVYKVNINKNKVI